MPDADEIRKSLEARIEELETELRNVRSAHAALTTGGGALTTDGAPRETVRRRERTTPGAAAGSQGIPCAIRQIFERWDAQGRPAQAAAVWQRDRWITAMPDHARLFEALPDRLDRSIVRQLVLEKPVTARGMFDAMIIVYAWGWSMTRVGVRRAQRTIGVGAERLGSALLAARDAMRTGGPRHGYAALQGPHRVAGLGPSFGSKFLYFASPEERRALILDQLVADWLHREVAFSLNATRWSIRTYEAYMRTMNRWSSGLDIPSHRLEEIVFTDEATRRGLAAWAAR